jgi:hypothetical protein
VVNVLDASNVPPIRETLKGCKPADVTRFEYLPCVTLIRDLHVLEMLNQSDTCHYLVVPHVPS